MADIDDRHPLIAQAHDQFEQAMSFTGGEGGGRFIHHQDTAVTVQGAGDFNLLLFGDGEFHHQVAGFELSAEAVNHSLRLGNHIPALNQPTAGNLTAEKDVFGDGQIRG